MSDYTVSSQTSLIPKEKILFRSINKHDIYFLVSLFIIMLIITVGHLVLMAGGSKFIQQENQNIKYVRQEVYG